METNKEEVQALIERLKRLESALETKNSKGPEADVSSPSPPPHFLLIQSRFEEKASSIIFYFEVGKQVLDTCYEDVVFPPTKINTMKYTYLFVVIKY